MYSVFYLDEVRKDILDAKQWYTEQQKGLDAYFVSAIKEAIANALCLCHKV